MARPREFEEARVLETALAVFWRKGYEATSIQDLIDATGVGRASLYGAFGDKEALFRRVLSYYIESVPTEALDLDDTLPVREALQRLARARLSVSAPPSGPRGCFLQIVATSRDDTPAARELLLASLTRSERLIERLLRRGQESGEVDPGRDAAALARFFVVMLQGSAASARGGWGPERLQPAIDQAIDHLLGRSR